MADIAMGEAQEDPLSLPPHGTEVFIGGLPRTITEQQLRDFASEAGDVHSAKLIKDPNNPSQNRGYGFIKFYTREAASAALERLHSRELPDFPGARVRIQPSQAKHRLFIGGIPHELSRDDLRNIVEPVVKGLEEIKMVKSKDPLHPEQNRGFAFLEFYNAACAAAAKTTLSQPDFKINDKNPTVDYAEPSGRDGGGGGERGERGERGGRDGGGGGVRNVFVGNLPAGATEDMLRHVFSKYGEVERTHIPRPKDGDSHSKFGFVHFRERAAATRAVEDFDKPEIEGALLNVRYGRSEGGQQRDVGGRGERGGGGGSSYGGGGGGYDGGGGGGAGGGVAGMPMQGMGMMLGGNMVSLVPVQLPNGQIGYMMAGGAGAGMPAGAMAGVPGMAQMAQMASMAGMAGLADASGGAGGPVRGSGGGYGGGGAGYGGAGGYGSTGRGGRGGRGGGSGQRYTPY